VHEDIQNESSVPEHDVHEDNELNFEDCFGQSNQVQDKGLEDVEEYNSKELDSGSDSDDDGSTKRNFTTFKLPNKMFDYKWEVGTYFGTKQEFQHAMRTYAIHSSREIKFVKNDRVRIRMICKESCDWNVYCAKIPKEETWQLRKVGPDHTCSRSPNVKMLNSKWLGTKLQPNVRENPSLRITSIINKTNEKGNIKVTKTKAM